VPLTDDTSARPAWHFTKLADGTYRIADSTGQSLTAAGSDSDDVRVTLSPWKETDDQKWEILKAPERQGM
jgi:hypothetical protein